MCLYCTVILPSSFNIIFQPYNYRVMAGHCSHSHWHPKAVFCVLVQKQLPKTGFMCMIWLPAVLYGLSLQVQGLNLQFAKVSWGGAGGNLHVHLGALLLCSHTAAAPQKKWVKSLLHVWDDGGRLERKLGNIGQGECLEDSYKPVFFTYW